MLTLYLAVAVSTMRFAGLGDTGLGLANASTRENVLAAMAETKSVCNQLHYPLQSGSDHVLAAMHRGYIASRFLERLRDARRLIDDLAVTTDIIVGFPGETEQQFVETLEVVAEAEFDGAYTFEFSPRPGTEAAEFVDRFVDADVVRERYLRLDVIAKRSALAKHEARIGRIESLVDHHRLTQARQSRTDRWPEFKRPRRGLDAVPDPHEQVVVQGLSQALERVADCRLSHGQVAGRPGEVALEHHLIEDPQQIQVEGTEVHR
jgi:tRNA A37 methylthiotransferase MiaB